jgi:hypothetical protein
MNKKITSNVDYVKKTITSEKQLSVEGMIDQQKGN